MGQALVLSLAFQESKWFVVGVVVMLRAAWAALGLKGQDQGPPGGPRFPPCHVEGPEFPGSLPPPSSLARVQLAVPLGGRQPGEKTAVTPPQHGAACREGGLRVRQPGPRAQARGLPGAGRSVLWVGRGAGTGRADRGVA